MRHFLIHITISTCLIFAYVNAQSQSNTIPKSDRFVILIDEFEPKSISTKSNYLSKKLAFQLPYYISSSLEKNNIQVIWYGEIISEQQSIKNQYNAGFNNVNIDLQTLNYYDIDYRIKGEYELFNETTYDISINIVKYGDSKQIVIDTTLYHVVENRNDIEIAMIVLSDKIKEIVKEPVQQKKLKSIGIFEIAHQAKKGKTNNLYLGKDLSFSIYYGLKESISKQSSFGLKNFIQDSITYTVNHDLLKEKKLDAAIGGQIEYIEDSLDISVEAYILLKRPRVRIGLPTLYCNSEYYYLISDKLYDNIREVLSGLIDENSNWNDHFLKTITISNYNELIDSARINIERNNIVLAEILLQKAQTLNTDWNYFYLYGLLKTYHGEFDSALSLYNKALELNDTVIKIYYEKSLLYDYFDNYGSAIENYVKIEELNPDYPNLYNRMGLTYALLDDYNSALKAFNKQLSKDSLNVEALWGLATSYYMLGIDSALTDTSKSISLINKSISILNEIIVLYEDDENVISNCYDIFIDMGIDQYYEDRLGLSLQLFQNAHQIDPNINSYDLIRLVYNKLALFDKADSLIQEGLGQRIYTDSIYYLQGEELRSIIIWNKSKKYYENALKYFNKYLELRPESSIAIRKRGATYFRLHQYNAAIEDYELAKKLENNDIEKSMILLDLAEVQVLNNNAEYGLVYLQELDSYIEQIPEEYKNEFIILQQFLYIVIHKILGNDTSEDEIQFQNLIANNFIKNWSFKTFQNWLINEENNLSAELIEELVELTNMAESRVWNFN